MLYYSTGNNLEKEFYRIKEISVMIGVAESTLYEWQRAKPQKFPRPELQPSRRLSLYSRQQIIDWLQQQQAAAQQ